MATALLHDQNWTIPFGLIVPSPKVLSENSRVGRYGTLVLPSGRTSLSQNFHFNGLPPPFYFSCYLLLGILFNNVKFHVLFLYFQTSFSFNVPYFTLPIQLLRMILLKTTNTKLMTVKTSEEAQDFVLKVLGREEYLVGDYPLIQFVYIQEMLARDMTPTVVTMSINNVAGKSTQVNVNTSFRQSCKISRICQV